DPVKLASVAIRLLDLADEGAVHRRGPSMPEPVDSGAERGRRPIMHRRPVMAVALSDYTAGGLRSPPESARTAGQFGFGAADSSRQGTVGSARHGALVPSLP